MSDPIRPPEVGDRRPIPAHRVSRRHLLLGGAIAAGATFLAACEAAQRSTANATPNATAPTAPAEPPVAVATFEPKPAPTTLGSSVPPASAGPTPAREDFAGTDLRIMSPGGYFDPYFTLGTAKWTAATGGKATAVTTNFEEYPIQMAGVIATADPSFDILYTVAAFGYMFRFGERVLLPVGDQVGDTADFPVGSLRGLTTADGVLRGLPLYDNAYVWGWNRKHFAAIGEDPDNPPDTYDALFDLAPRFRAKGIIPCVQPWLATQGTLFAQLYWTQIYNSTGHPMFSDDRTQVMFDGDDGVRTFETIERGIRTGWWDRTYMNLANDNDAYKVFGAGNVATVMEGAYAIATGEMAQFGPNHGVRQFPGITAGTTGSVGGPGGSAVSRFSKNVDASWSWMRAQFGADIAKAAALSPAHYPVARTSVITDPDVVRAVPLLAAVALQYRGATNPWPTPYDTQPVFNEVIAKLISGDYTARQAHAAAVKGCQEAIIKYLSS